ncbi:hypothetical protein SCHPADRAFT_341411 [Schizopora paradoxa]|uniref:Uncharacterized protein n=1 Tax=Schizopora paradoxa TaxID=27342 RepID=A0A0H2RPY3_9AGAM|nr:hypothetical protein SCHPADRAFT_341411 [Schizopora paradoxa]
MMGRTISIADLLLQLACTQILCSLLPHADLFQVDDDDESSSPQQLKSMRTMSNIAYPFLPTFRCLGFPSFVYCGLRMFQRQDIEDGGETGISMKRREAVADLASARMKEVEDGEL